jgi:alpha-glucosidase
MNIIPFNNEKLKVEVFDEKVIKFHFSKNGKWHDSLYSQFLEKVDFKKVNFKEDEHRYYFSTKYLRVEIDKHISKIVIYDKQGNLLSSDYENRGYILNGEEIYCYKKITYEKGFFGFGVRRGTLNKKGSFLINWNTDDPNHFFNTDPLYQCHPFFLAYSRNFSYGIFFGNTFRSYFDIGRENPTYYYFHSEGGDLIYFFIYGPTPKEVIYEYTKLVGRSYFPPLWALGYQQSRWSYKTERELERIAKEFRKRSIPCDVLYLDIDYMKDYKVFTINEKRFKDFVKLAKNLKEKGFKLVTIVDPGVKIENGYEIYEEGIEKDYFCKLPDGSYSTGYVWPGECVFPDFCREEVRNWWKKKQNFLISSGVSGIWNDMNEPAVLTKTDFRLMKLIFNFLNFKYPPALFRTEEFIEKLKKIKMKTLSEDTLHGDGIKHSELHNIYGYLMTKASYEGMVDTLKNKRPFVLTRSGFPGIQKYSAVWAGDNQSSWKHLYMSIMTLLNLSVSGVPFVGEDVGGFWKSLKSSELFVRWIELGVFYPFFRVHSAVNTSRQEPWSFGSRYEKIIVDYIRLRYKLLPYIYSIFKEAVDNGIPLMRPLFFEFPEDENCCKYEDQFMFGPYFLVAPVYHPGGKNKRFYLPEGNWFSFFDDTFYDGEKEYERSFPLERIPLFVREGAIIPMWENSFNFVGEKRENNLIVKIYPGNGEFYYYEDDGESFSYKNGEYNLYLFKNNGGSVSDFSVEILHRGYDRGVKQIFLEGLGYQSRIFSLT